MKKLEKENTFIGPASLGKRILAFIIDIVIILLIISLTFSSITKKIFPQNYSISEIFSMANSDSSLGTILTLISLSMFIITFLYFYLLEKKLKQTIGKIMLNIYITSGNKELKSWQVLVRNLYFLPISPLIFLLGVVDVLFLVFNKNGQRLLEILSKTRVVEQYKYNLNQ